jgi:hypothetical protein
MWHLFWENKIKSLSLNNIFHSFTLPLAYHTEIIEDINIVDGSTKTRQIEIAREKGIDVRLALDIVRLAIENEYDLGIIFSQDRDLHEAVKEVLAIRNKQNRWLMLESAFPICDSIEKHLRRGIPDTDWVRIEKDIYDQCIDNTEYRPTKILPLFPK